MAEKGAVISKIAEIREEMKRTGLWKTKSPSWVREYAQRRIANEQDFAGWLQFVYLPNRQQAGSNIETAEDRYIGPQAIQFFGEDVKRGQLLQLLIELDAL